MSIRAAATALFAVVTLPNVLLARQTSSPPSDTTAAVVAWLADAAIPFRTLEAGQGTTDLQPLKSIWKDVQVIGIGESTHGTREFFQVRHRLLEFLATEMGFNAFAIEAALSDSQPINDYILYGRGDLATVLTGQGYMAWDTEEFTAMLEWMRDYNRRVPEERKLKFFGLDLFRNEFGRGEVLRFLEAHAPVWVDSVVPVFRILSEQEARWPSWDTAAVKRTLPPLQSLAKYLATNRDGLARGSSSDEVEETERYLRVMLQGITQIDTGLRSRHMGENLVDLLENEERETKVLVWAHTAHITAASRPGGGVGMGGLLRQALGERYYAVIQEFAEGSYQFRVGAPAAELAVGTVGPAPSGSLPWHLDQTPHASFFVDFRRGADDHLVAGWLRSPQVGHVVGWLHGVSTGNPNPFRSSSTALRDRFDGAFFIRRSTPTRPTANALQMAAEHRGF